jgi:hypothetical protein
MPRIPSIFEQELRNASPAVPDEAFLARLTACAEGRHTELSEEEMEFGELLRATKPRDIPGANCVDMDEEVVGVGDTTL